MKARSLIEMFESCDENTKLLVSCNGVETRTHSVNYHVQENKIVIIPTIRNVLLTEREKWLMQTAWNIAVAGRKFNLTYTMNDWLEDMAADAVTVEMVLAKDAPL